MNYSGKQFIFNGIRYHIREKMWGKGNGAVYRCYTLPVGDDVYDDEGEPNSSMDEISAYRIRQILNPVGQMFKARRQALVLPIPTTNSIS